MGFYINRDCIGCGPCEQACPQGAISKTDSFLGVFVVDPMTCNDCAAENGGALCVAVCPVDALHQEPRFPICHGRGCPLSTDKLSSYECSEGRERCSCGNMLWRRPDSEVWFCSRCDEGMKVTCPKPNSMPRLIGAAEADTGGSPFGFDAIVPRKP